MKLGALLALCGALLGPAHAGTVGDPFTGAPIQITGTPGAVTMIEAENFDNGGEGVAYHSLLTGPCTQATCSCTQTYRQESAGICGSAFVTHTGAGTWYEYTVNVNAVGSYTVELLAAIGQAACCGAAAYHVEVDGAPVLDPATGKVASIALTPTIDPNWNRFEWTGKSPLFPMVPGVHRLRIAVDQGWFNWESIRVKFAAGIEWQQVPVWKVYP